MRPVKLLIRPLPIFAALVFIALFAHMPDLGGDTPSRLLFGWAIFFALIGFFGWHAAGEQRLIVPFPVLVAGSVPPLFFFLYAATGFSLEASFVWTPALVFLNLALLFVALINYRWSKNALRYLVGFCVLAQGLILLGSNDYPWLAAIPGPVAWPSGQPLVFGGYWQVNVMANMLACLALWAAFDVAQSGPVTRLQMVYGPVAFILFPLVIGWSRSGSGALGLIIGVLILALMAWRQSDLLDRRKLSFVLLLVIVCFLAAGNPGFGGEGSQVVEKVTNSSAPARIGIWLRSLYAFGEAPLFGHGLGNFAPVYNEVALRHGADIPYRWIDNTRHAHNLILHWLVEIGLVGTAIILAPFIWFGLSLLRHNAHHWATLAIIAPLLVHIMTGYPQRQSAMPLLLILLVIVYMAHPTGWSHAFSIRLKPVRPWLRYVFVSAFSVPLLVASIATGISFSYASARHMALSHGRFHPKMIVWRLTHADMNHPFLGTHLRHQTYFALSVRALLAQDKAMLKLLLPVLHQLEGEALRGAKTWNVLIKGYIITGDVEKARQVFDIAHRLAPEYAHSLIDEMATELKQNHLYIINAVAPNHRPAGQ